MIGRLRKSIRRQPRQLVLGISLLGIIVLIAALAPILANKRPIAASYQGTLMFPALSNKTAYVVNGEVIALDYADWHSLNLDWVIWPVVPFSPSQKDFESPHSPPLSNGHLLGTNRLGEDVLSGIIHGSRVSVLVGLLSAALAGLIGIALGLFAGYWGNTRLRISKATLAASPFYVFIILYFGIYAPKLIWSTRPVEGLLLLLLSVLLTFGLSRLIKRMAQRRSDNPRSIPIPFDNIFKRLIELKTALPSLVLILVFSAYTEPSYAWLILILGSLGWIGAARLVRAETLRLKDSSLLQSLTAAGLKPGRILAFHLLPLVLVPLRSHFILLVASFITVEASLSFLGIGVPPEGVTWGSLLASGKSYFPAWWLVVFPGLCLLMCLTGLNLIASSLKQRTEGRAIDMG